MIDTNYYRNNPILIKESRKELLLSLLLKSSSINYYSLIKNNGMKRRYLSQAINILNSEDRITFVKYSNCDSKLHLNFKDFILTCSVELGNEDKTKLRYAFKKRCVL